ncbi:MAG: hypothetical protein DWQ05_09300 [Calditrichaeota bacterium]|nr:MAG: hypothetical protein DWQ05_09300 [Calditrichota bacterium]
MLVSLISFDLFAQEKKAAPPPTAFKIETDSLKALPENKKPKSGQQSGKKENLKLPDVLIYGKDTAKHVGGTKKSIENDNTELVTPDTNYEPMSLSNVEQGKRQTLEKESSGKYQQADARIYGGQFTQWGGSANFWTANPVFDIGFDGEFKHSDGEFRNQESDRIDAEMNFGMMGNNNSGWRFKVRHSSNDFKLYGAVVDSAERKITMNQLDFLSKGKLSFGLVGKARLNYALVAIYNKNLQNNDDKRKVLSFDSEFTKKITDFELSLQPSAYFVRSDADSINNAYFDWYSLKAKTKIPVSPKLITDFSLGVQAVDFGDERNNQFSADIGAIYIPASVASIRMRFFSGYRFLPWHKLIEQNGFIANDQYSHVEKINWGTNLTFDWRLNRKMTLLTAYSLQSIDGFLYFERNGEGLFNTQTIDLHLRQFDVGLKIQLNTAIELEGHVKLEDYKLRNLRDNGQLYYDLPYFAEFQAPFNITYKPIPKLELNGEVHFIGERAYLLTSTDKLPVYSALSASILFHINDHFNLFLNGNNLTDSHHQIWQGYKSVGANILGGFGATW